MARSNAAILVCCLTVASGAVSTPFPETITYEVFLKRVATSHPEQTLDEQRLQAVRAREERVGTLPDPSMSIGRDETPLPLRFQGMTPEHDVSSAARWQLSISQSMPWPGTLGAESDAAAARTAVATASSAAAAAARKFEASELFLRLVKTSKLIEVQHASLEVVSSIRNFANEKFKQGMGSHFEFLKSHSEAGVLRANIGALETDLENLKRHALTLMNDRDVENPDAVQFLLDWPKELASFGSPNLNSDAPDLTRGWIETERRAELAGKAAEYDRTLPSFTASGMLMQEDGGMRMYGFAVGAAVPLFSGAQRRSLSGEKALIEARANGGLAWYDRRRKLALAQAEGRIDRILGNLRILEREIIPPVREHLESATVRFSQGREEIGHIIEGRRTLLSLETDTITMTEALGLARLAYDKIAAGFVDGALDVPVPQLSGAAGGSMGMEGAAGGMQAMPPPKGSRSRSSTPSTKAQPESAPEETTTPKSGMSGMGM